MTKYWSTLAVARARKGTSTVAHSSRQNERDRNEKSWSDANSSRGMRVAFVSTYPPRQCGIGVFCQDLLLALGEVKRIGRLGIAAARVVAIDSAPYRYDYPSEVCFQIRNYLQKDYGEAAEFLNLSPIDVVSIQHEFGIFGGADGEYVIDLMEAVRKPLVTTLHTVLKNPTPGQRGTLRRICNLSTRIVVQAHCAVEMLADVYAVPRSKIHMIHHGVPHVPFLDPAFHKGQCGAGGRQMILTCGLISPNKGIECAIDALATVAQVFPDVLYVVLGATHPEVRKRFGETYRSSLEEKVKERGLEHNVSFVNRFVTKEELIRFLVAADVYCTPYTSVEQTSSGTLAYAVACGKAVVSTPYLYAEELLADGRGVLVPFGDPTALAEEIGRLLDDQGIRDRIRMKAYQFGRHMLWTEAGASYLKVFGEAMEDHGTASGKVYAQIERPAESPRPDVNLNHLKTLTDDTGVLQHARFLTPDREHGYCTDDNARALIVSVTNWHLFRDEEILPLIDTYLAFLTHSVHRGTGRVRNLMSYDRGWLEDVGSEDSHGRTLWALGHCVAYGPSEAVSNHATQLFNLILRHCAVLRSPRAAAYSILGCLTYLRRFGGDTGARAVACDLAYYLANLLRSTASDDWVWFEDIVVYANARLPQALVGMGNLLKDKELLHDGLRSLEWLLAIQTDPSGKHLSLVGCNGWYPRGEEKAKFDQQPVEIPCLLDACHEAFLATGEEKWLLEMERCFGWFLGRNDVGEAVCDLRSGGCRDGIGPSSMNDNEGAEATLSWLMALHSMPPGILLDEH